MPNDRPQYVEIIASNGREIVRANKQQTAFRRVINMRRPRAYTIRVCRYTAAGGHAGPRVRETIREQLLNIVASLSARFISRFPGGVCI